MDERLPKVSSKELLRNFSQFADSALVRPVIITKNNRNRLALMSFEAFVELLEASGTSVSLDADDAVMVMSDLGARTKTDDVTLSDTPA